MSIIKIQIGLTFLVLAYSDCPGKEAVCCSYCLHTGCSVDDQKAMWIVKDHPSVIHEGDKVAASVLQESRDE